MRDMERRILLDGAAVTYTLERKRVKNVNLRVRGGRVFVSAPRWIPPAVIEAFLRERADFILGALERTEKASLPCSAGEELPYLGRRLVLALEKGSRASVRVEGNVLRAALRTPEDGESVRRALKNWYRGESERLCLDYYERLFPRFAALGVPQAEIRMRQMRSCWGNCRPQKRVVTFNAMLAAVPEACVEYVVAHELTHFLYADHSSAFYAALASVIPDWKARRKTLRPFAALLND